MLRHFPQTILPFLVPRYGLYTYPYFVLETYFGSFLVGNGSLHDVNRRDRIILRVGHKWNTIFPEPVADLDPLFESRQFLKSSNFKTVIG